MFKDLAGLFQTQGMLFFIMFLGVALGKYGSADNSGKKQLTDLLLYVTLPASILHSFQMEISIKLLMACMAVILTGLITQVGSYILGRFLYNNCDKKHKKVLQYATICTNAGILGNALVEGICGQEGLLYASLYAVPQRVFMWSVGLTYFTEAPDRKTLLKKVLTHPCILAVFAGFFLLITQIPLPGVLQMTLNDVAGCNSFLAMILVGMTLSNVKFSEVVEKQTVYYSVIRLIIIPFLVYTGCHLAGLDPLVTEVSVILSGMPAASVTAIIASKYNADEKFAAKCVVLSTLLSLITVPAWCMLVS